MQDFLNDIWVSDFGNDTQCTAAQCVHSNINIKHMFERFAAATLSSGERARPFVSQQSSSIRALNADAFSRLRAGLTATKNMQSLN